MASSRSTPAFQLGLIYENVKRRDPQRSGHSEKLHVGQERTGISHSRAGICSAGIDPKVNLVNDNQCAVIMTDINAPLILVLI